MKIELEPVMIEPLLLTIRDFTHRQTPIYGPAGEVTGVRVDLMPALSVLSLGAVVFSFEFERSEFVNFATAGLGGLQAADEEDGLA